MKIKLKDDQILYWPVESKYNFLWNFDVEYELELYDGKIYHFRTQFSFNIKEKEIYYSEMRDLIPFSKINWDWRTDTDEQGNHLKFANIKNFIFYNTSYVCENDELNGSKNIFSGGLNPMKWPDEEMDKNRDLMGDWWQTNYPKLLSHLMSKKDEYNNLLIEKIKSSIIQ